MFKKRGSYSSVKTEYKEYKLNKTQTIILALSFLLSVISLSITVVMNLKSVKADQFARANAGDINAQFFLANHYYEIGDLNECLYWYKIVSSDEGELGAYAKNNLAVLYLKIGIDGNNDFINELSINIDEKSNRERYLTRYLSTSTEKTMRYKIIKLFETAYAGGVDEALINMYAYLSVSPKEAFSIPVYEEKMNWIKEELKNKHVEEDMHYEFGYELVGMESGQYVPADTEEFRYVTVDSEFLINEESGVRIIFTYLVYKKSDTQTFDYLYVNLK